jgi:hypothetical protein
MMELINFAQTAMSGVWAVVGQGVRHAPVVTPRFSEHWPRQANAYAWTDTIR